ncbi:MAG: polyhydroxyalkanoate synthesis regulator DNA-binding domain-containing protein [Acidobacteriota bacterium]
MSDVRIIKKYENRRMYDTEESRYVNLEAIAKLIREGAEVQVVDAKTDEDLTGHVLTQIIVDEAKNPGSGVPTSFLRDLIRAGDRANRDFLEWYLGTAADVYQRVQDAWTRRGRSSKEQWAQLWDPLGAMRWMRRRVVAAQAAGEEDAEEPEGQSAADSEELAELRRRLEDLESRLG